MSKRQTQGADVPIALWWSMVVDAIVDGLLGGVLFVAPDWALHQFGWHPVDPVVTRLLAAALLGMSAQTWFARNGGIAQTRAGLNLKVVWTGFATIGLAIAVIAGSPALATVALIAFAIFFIQWVYWRIRIHRLV